MGPHSEIGEKLKATLEPSARKANGSVDKKLENELVYTANYEGNKLGKQFIEQSEKVHITANVEVDIMECTNSGGNKLVEAECLDTTESSSSFDDSDCGVVGTFDDSEALSGFHGDNGATLDFYGFDELFRPTKKELTTHWKSFIQPLKWRCKYAELQIKKLDAQALRYDRELEGYTQQKQVPLGISELESVGVKSLPFSHNYVKREVFTRKKRRRAEATKDVSEYISQHNLFSYYDNRKNVSWSALMDIEFKNHAKANLQTFDIADESLDNDQLLFVKNENDDNSLEDVFRKIEHLQSRVGKLKSRMEKVKSENIEDLPSTDGLSSPIPDNSLVISPPNSVSPPNTASSPDYGNGMSIGDYIASQLISEYNNGDALVPEIIFSNGEGDNDVLIDNERAKEMRLFEQLKTEPIQRPLLLKDGLGNANCSILAKADAPTDGKRRKRVRFISDLPSPKGNNKRSRRKGGPG